MQNNKLTNSVLDATFAAGMLRGSDGEVYFDKNQMDVLVLTRGYLSSVMGDQTIENRRLLYKIEEGADEDEIIEGIHELVPRLMLPDFIDEYKAHAHTEPFSTFITSFSEYWKAKMSELRDEEVELDELFYTKNTQKAFIDKFGELYHHRYKELGESFGEIYLSTTREIAKNWIVSLY